MVGRGDERAALADSVKPGAVVTIVGPPGLGKTRLARAVLDDWLIEPSRAGAFVDLSDVHDEPGLLSTWSRALGVDRSHAGDFTALTAMLQTQSEALFVLDNFEQLVDATGDTIAKLLPHLGDCRLLITSQRRLGISGETVFPLNTLAHDDAVALFVDRARRARPDYELGDDAAVVGKLVDDLDRLPLALELAASRMGLMGPAQIADDLRPKASPLQAAIEWSWQLLDDVERNALTQCAVFRGGFSLEAAEQVVRCDSERPVVDILAALLDRSLIYAYASPSLAHSRRLSLLASIREFADSQLRDREAVERRWIEYFTRQTDGHLEHPDTIGALRADADNLEAVIDVALRSGDDVGSAVRAAVSLQVAFATYGPADRYLRIADRVLGALGHDAVIDGVDHAQLLLARGDALRATGRRERAAADYEKAKHLAGDDERIRGRAEFGIGTHWFDVGDDDKSFACYERALELHRSSGDRLFEARSLGNMATLHSRAGDDSRAESLYRKSMAVANECGATHAEAINRLNLAGLALDRGDPTHAMELMHGLDLLPPLAPRTQARALLQRGVIQLDVGDPTQACASFEESLDVFRRAGERRLNGLVWLALSLARCERGDLAEAGDCCRRAAIEFTESTDDRGLALSRCAQASIAASAGNVQQARTTLAAAQALATDTPSPTLAAAIRLQHGMIACAEGHLDRAREHSAVPDQALMSSEVRSMQRLLRAAVDLRPQAPTAELPAFKISFAAGGWFELGNGERIDLRRRGTTRRLLQALVRNRVDAPGTAISANDLIERGWPDETALNPEVLSKRLYTALWSLRKLGLGDVLQTREDGYLLDPRWPLIES